MDNFVIRGGKPLYGDVKISGMKNSALPIIFGTVAAGDICTIENIPDVSDIFLTFEILREIGAKVRLVTTDTVIIDTREVFVKSPSVGLVDKMRASTYLLGAMLGRFGEGLVGISLILKIAGIGLVVSVAVQILQKSGRDEQATFVTVAGVVIAMLLLAGEISSLFSTLKRVFGL